VDVVRMVRVRFRVRVRIMVRDRVSVRLVLAHHPHFTHSTSASAHPHYTLGPCQH